MYHFDDKKPTEDSKEYITGNKDVINKFKTILDEGENLKDKFKKYLVIYLILEIKRLS